MCVTHPVMQFLCCILASFSAPKDNQIIESRGAIMKTKFPKLELLRMQFFNVLVKFLFVLFCFFSLIVQPR